MDSIPIKNRKTHILTVALEDYFHGPAFSKVISSKRWAHFETRFEQNCLDVLDKLDSASAHATFFANSWVARRCPGILKEVIRRGNEIALAGQRGVSFRHLTRSSLRDQVQRDRDILEHHTSQKMLGFRVTDTLLGERDLWALDELATLGFRYDSSLSPFLRNFHSQPWRRHIHKSETLSGDFWEVPLSSERFAGLFIPFAGGNYFRQLPKGLIKKLLELGTRSEVHPLVLYFRLWDFDAEQPRLQTGSFIRDFRHYRNSDRMIQMMDELLGRFRFSSISEHLKLQPLRATIPAGDYAETVTSSSSQRNARTALPISVIVPCFNEERGIPFLASNLASLKTELQSHFETEFILVDDGSSDQTWASLQRNFADDPNVKLIRHSSNQGVSAAIMTGLEHAREIACSLDCDCSYDPAQLKPMLHLLTPGVDLVTASPYHPAGAVLNVPGWRLLLSRVSSMLYRVVTGKKLYTFTACVRVYRKSSAIHTKLSYRGFLGVAELLGKMALDEKNIVEHPATLEVRIFGQSKMKVIRTIFGHLNLLGELSWRRFRTKVDPTSAERRSGNIPNVKSLRFPVPQPTEAEVEKS